MNRQLLLMLLLFGNGCVFAGTLSNKASFFRDDVIYSMADVCGDFLKQEGIVIPNLEFQSCTNTGSQVKGLEAVYVFDKKYSGKVERALKKSVGLPYLKSMFECKGWKKRRGNSSGYIGKNRRYYEIGYRAETIGEVCGPVPRPPPYLYFVMELGRQSP